MDTLIPFGILKSNGRYVSVDEVPSGNKCGCLCPSCEGPLNARKGGVLKHHFAHVSKTASETEACRISFIRALLWMSVEILQEMSVMKLPSLTYHYRSLRTDTPIRAAELTEVDYVLDSTNSPRLDATQESITLTILVSGVPISIQLIANGFIPSISPTARNAVLAIDLVPAGKLIDHAKSGYKQILVDFLKNNTESKSWVSHPRLAKRFEEVRKQNSARYNQPPGSPTTPDKGTLALASKEDKRQLERFCIELNRNDTEEERVEVMIQLARHISVHIDKTGRQCFNCRMMTPQKTYFKRCPYCNSAAWGDQILSEEYLTRARSQYLTFGYAKDSLEKAILYLKNK